MNSNGCFYHCTNCKIQSNCCSNFDKINAPVLNKEEVNNIKNSVENKDFFNTISNNLYSLKTKDNKCIFYINDKCTIYNNRPLDCRLFPFDIINKNNKYYLILYNLKCLNTLEFKHNLDNINNLIENIIPWIKDFTKDTNYTKMNNFNYTIIKEIII